MCLFLLSGFAVAADFGDLKALSVPPEDTLDAENLRIWLPVERVSSCRVRLDIRDDSGQVVRQMFDRVIRRGYYNFYWDKQDDSGRYVDEGEYTFIADLCGKERTGSLTVLFRPGETDCILLPESDSIRGLIFFDILRDSAVVSLSVCNWLGKEVASPVKDSVFSTGRHKYRWQPEGRVIPSRYRVHLAIKDYVHKTEIHKPR